MIVVTASSSAGAKVGAVVAFIVLGAAASGVGLGIGAVSNDAASFDTHCTAARPWSETEICSRVSEGGFAGMATVAATAEGVASAVLVDEIGPMGAHPGTVKQASSAGASVIPADGSLASPSAPSSVTHCSAA